MPKNRRKIPFIRQDGAMDDILTIALKSYPRPLRGPDATNQHRQKNRGQFHDPGINKSI
jgi:hypothetical protein